MGQDINTMSAGTTNSHSLCSLTTGPQSLTKPDLHRVQTSVSSVKFQCLLQVSVTVHH